jgi:hypothetical protein
VGVTLGTGGSSSVSAGMGESCVGSCESCACWIWPLLGCWPFCNGGFWGPVDRDVEEPENLADMLENHEPLRPGEVPLWPFWLSVEADRDLPLRMDEPLGDGDGSRWLPLVCEAPFVAGDGIGRGCDAGD